MALRYVLLQSADLSIISRIAYGGGVASNVSCSKDKKRKKPKKGWYVCKGCGQARKDKDIIKITCLNGI